MPAQPGACTLVLPALLSLSCVTSCGDDGTHETHARSDKVTPDARTTGDSSAEPHELDEALDAEPPEVLEHAGDWPLPNRDYENTRATFDSPVRADNIVTLEERFFVPIPGVGVFGHATSSALVLGNTIYLQDMGSNVLAIDKRDGTVLWTQRYDLATVGPNGVAIGYGRLYAMRGDVGAVALDVRDGSELWRFDPPLDAAEGLDIQPIAYAGSVFLSTVPASVRGPYLGGGRGELLALDVRDGTQLFGFDTVESEDLWGDAERNCGGGAWYPPAIDRERGATYWGTGNPGPLAGTPDYGDGDTRPGDNAYTSGVLAIGLERGELLWFHQERPHDIFDLDFQNTPILVRGEELGIGGDRLIASGKTGTVVGLDAESGALAFRTAVGLHVNDELRDVPEEGVRVAPGVFGGVLTAPAYADGVVYVPVVNYPTTFLPQALELEAEAPKGELVALDARDGAELWSHTLPAAPYGAATVVNDLVLVPDADGVLHAIAREDGALVHQYRTHGGINAPVTVVGELVLVQVGLSVDRAGLLGLVVR